MRQIISFFILIGCCFAAAAQFHPDIFPKPQQLDYQQGYLLLRDISVCQPKNASPDITFVLQGFSAIVQQQTGKAVKKVTTASAATLQYRVQRAGEILPDTAELQKQSDREQYSLRISARGIQIEAATSTGLYYAIQTLRQMIVQNPDGAALPYASILDRPAIPYRGVMMDFAHGGLLTVEEIKRQIDFLALWKSNQYYFYNEVSIALDGFEQLNFKQHYTKDQIREIIAYGRQRHIDVVPFMAFYGHQHDLLKKESFANLGIGRYGHEFDPRKPEVMQLLRNWIGQYAALFPSPFFHVGFDETWETNRIAKESDSTINAESLWLSHLLAIRQELKRYGKSVLAWTDMSHYYPNILSKFPQDVLPVIWEYSPDSTAMYHYLDPVLASKRKFLIQPAVSGWGHIYPATDYTYDNIDLCIRTGMREGTRGFITSVWTDAVEPLVRPSWLFMAYGCVAGWQGAAADRLRFENCFARTGFPGAALQLQAACSKLAKATDILGKCFGNNTGNMPGGTIIESWSNPFNPYYLKIAATHTDDLKQVRLLCEAAEGELIQGMANAGPSEKSFLESMRVTAKLMHYQATRFLWAQVICTRWDEAMLMHKQNNFVFYDLSYLCHGLIQDLMDDLGTLKEDYSGAWLAESMPYRKQTILGRFDVEYGLWQKLLLKLIDYRIQHSADYVAPAGFVEVFHPDF